MVTFWEGAYVSYGNREQAEVEIAATRFGRTRARPTRTSRCFHMSFTDRAPNSSTISIASRRSTEASVPPALSWNVARPPSVPR